MKKKIATLFAVAAVLGTSLPAALASTPPPRRAVPAKTVVLRDVTGKVCFRGTLARMRTLLLRGALCP